jgi:hypothetical protein
MSVSVRMVAHAYAKLFSKYIAIMKKKIYNQPQTEVSFVNTERMMQDMLVSVNPGGGGGTAGAPGRKGDIIP